MVSEFSERNESGQKTFSGREFVKPRLHYGDPIVPPGHCDAPPLPVIAIRPHCHCGAPPPSLRRATPVIASGEAAKQTIPRPPSWRRPPPRERRSPG